MHMAVTREDILDCLNDNEEVGEITDERLAHIDYTVNLLANSRLDSDEEDQDILMERFTEFWWEELGNIVKRLVNNT